MATLADLARRILPAGLASLAGLACAACCAVPLLLGAGVLSGAGWAVAGAWMPGIAVALAALAEIGGAWLIWQGWREHRGLWWIAGGILALGAYGFVATFQPDPNFGRILAAYGGIFVAGSLAWGILVDGFRPDRWDITGALLCLAGVAVIMYAPRAAGH
jgi:small multidrug resistance family-3 protein